MSHWFLNMFILVKACSSSEAALKKTNKKNLILYSSNILYLTIYRCFFHIKQIQYINKCWDIIPILFFIITVSNRNSSVLTISLCLSAVCICIALSGLFQNSEIIHMHIIPVSLHLQLAVQHTQREHFLHIKDKVLVATAASRRTGSFDYAALRHRKDGQII